MIAWTTFPGLPVFRQCQDFCVSLLLFAGVCMVMGGVGLGADSWWVVSVWVPTVVMNSCSIGVSGWRPLWLVVGVARCIRPSGVRAGAVRPYCGMHSVIGWRPPWLVVWVAAHRVHVRALAAGGLVAWLVKDRLVNAGPCTLQ